MLSATQFTPFAVHLLGQFVVVLLVVVPFTMARDSSQSVELRGRWIDHCNNMLDLVLNATGFRSSLFTTGLACSDTARRHGSMVEKGDSFRQR